MVISIAKILENTDKWIDKTVELQAWVQFNRVGKKVSFFKIHDGSHFYGCQVVYKVSGKEYDYKKLNDVGIGSAVSLIGKVKLPSGGNEKFEIELESFVVNGKADENYPLQKKDQGLAFLRENSEIRARTQLYKSIFNIRQILFQSLHTFFWAKEFQFLAASTLTKNDCEGSGETFNLTTSGNAINSFFKTKAMLAVSSQMQAEAWAQTYKNVYTFGPTYRADKSKTSFHAAEFWMLEPEVAFATLDDIILLAQEMIQNVAKKILDKGGKELDFLSNKHEVNLIERVTALTKKETYIKITYQEALKKINLEFKKQGKKVLVWGVDFAKEDEMLLCHLLGDKIVTVTDYPLTIKAFYMKLGSQKKGKETVKCFDIFFPELGEVVGGSERENDYETLMEMAKNKNINLESLSWYSNLRKMGYGGSSGFGLGFDRLLIYLTGASSIKDVIPFYVGFNTLNY